MPLFPINDLTGGLNLTLSSNIPDNNLVVCKNMYYNKDKQLETRRGYKAFGASTGISPVTSLFFFQRDDNLARYLFANGGDKFMKYDNTLETRSTVQSGLSEFETIPAISGQRTRRDYAVYKNVLYMANGVDSYCKYDLSTFTSLGVAAGVVCTADNTTDFFTKVAHGLINGDEVKFTSTGTVPTGITSGRFYYVVSKTADTFQVSASKDGTPINFTTNGTGTISYFKTTLPRIRYVQYLADRIFGAGDDSNPTTLYYTTAAPSDANTINSNVLVVGGDENGRINGLNEQGETVLAFKDEKIYAIDLTTPSSLPIDAQTGGYADRTIHPVGNSLMYFNGERGIDKLQVRYASTGGNALESKPLSDNIRRLTQLVEAQQYNAGTAIYARPYNNYYITLDTNGDNVPDTTIVYSSLVGGWTQYTYPAIYDYARYIDNTYNDKYLFSPATDGQIYEMEVGYTDNGQPIPCEIETKRFDFKNPSQFKTYQFVDVTGWKALGTTITVKAKVNDVVETEGTITDSNIVYDYDTKMVGIRPIGVDTLGAGTASETLTLYRYIVRLPMYSMGNDIAINLSSNGGVWIAEKMMISSEQESIDIFNYGNII